MNKTIEALKLAEEALVKANHFHDYEDALAAIREALADQFPDATKMMDEPVAMMNSVGNTEAYRRTEQQTKGFDIPLYAAPVQPVNTRSCSEYSEVEYSEPVKSAIMTKQQIEELSKKMWDELQHIAFEENTPKYWTYVVNNTWRNIDEQQPPEDAYDEGTLEPLYAAPVDAKAIRAEALEEAAKVCDDESRYSNDAECCAAAIRGLK